MKSPRLLFSLLFSAAVLMGIFSTASALAQSITAANDGTGTDVITNGNRFDIQGGKLSKDGTNLFHSFSQFDLNAGQTANFQSYSSIQNILGRVVSGNASIINGLIQVSGSQANLYLMNPAGIIFGSNASLNVPASFFATTATGIGIGNHWFNAAGINDYAQLNGTPNGFAFTTTQPGSIVNSGNLAVGAGNDLMLLGGTVVNTGQLNAPSGKITIAAVPGTSLVRLSQPGSVLSLEVLPPASGSNSPTQWTLPVLSLPQLLTGGSGGNATGISVNAAGQTVLTGSGIQVPTEPGSAIASGSLNTFGTAPEQMGGTVHVLGNKVGLVSANIDASGTSGGGTVLIGGDYQGKGTVPNASRTYVSSDSTINTDALTQGNGGKVILWADEITGFHGNISARGGSNSGNGGFVEVSGKQDLIFDGTANLSAAKGSVGTLLLDPTDITISNAPSSPGVDAQLNGTAQILQNDFSPTPGSIVISQATLEGLPNTANVILEATNNITIGPLTGNQLTFASAFSLPPGSGGSVTFRADADNSGAGNFVMNSGDLIFAQSRNLTITGANVTLGQLSTSSAPTNSGAINITATNGNITANGYINATSVNANAGSITLSAPNGNITLNANMDSRSTLGNGGEIRLEADGNITTQSLLSNIEGTAAFNGGNITLISSAGAINTSAGVLQSFSGGGSGGDVEISALNGITTGAINSSSSATIVPNRAGRVTLNAGVSNMTLDGDINASSTGATGNPIELTGNVILTQPNTTLTSAGANGSGSIIFNNPIDGTTAGLQSLTLNSGIAPIILNGIGNTVPLGSLTTNGTGNVQLSGNYTVLNDYIFNNPVSLIGETTINAGNTLTFNNTLAAGANNLTLSANEINFANTVSGTGNLTLQPLATNQAIAIGGATDSGAGTLDLLVDDLAVLSAGFNSITIGRTDSTAALTLAGNVTFNDPVTLRASTINTTGGTLTANATTTLLANQAITAGNINSVSDLTMVADEIDLTGAVSGNGTLSLQPFTTSQAIQIGNATDSGLGVLDLLNSDIAALQDDFTNVIIGRTNGTGSVTINNATIFNVPITIAGGSELVVVGSNPNTIWNLTGTNQGNLNNNFPNGFTFNNIEKLTGGIANDTFVFNDGVTFAGVIAGGGGLNTLDYSAFTTPLTVNLANLGATNIAQVIGTAAAPSTLIGANAANNWNITGNNSGTVNGTLNFVAFNTLVGGNLDDTFVFKNGQGISGAIDGAGGKNTLNYSAYTTPVIVNLAANTATGVGGNIRNIQNAIAGTSTNTLIGANTPNTWNIRGTNNGDINNTFTFTAFSNLIGGNSDDTFTLKGGRISTINGGGGNNTLIGDNVLNTWNITGANSGTVNGITSFSAIGNVTGGNLDDVFQFSPSASISGNINGRAGNLTLIGDEINFAGNVSGTGNLILQPLTPTQGIQLGGTDSNNSNVLTLTATELSLLQDGFTSIAIGGSDSSGAIKIVSPVTFSDPVTIQVPVGDGSITATGAITGLDNASITLKANRNITTSNITANPGITIISSNGKIDTSAGILDSSSTIGNGGAISLSALGNITTNQLTSHSATGAGGDITLNSQTGAISSGNLDASGNTRGGNITVMAREQITTGQINSSAITGDGGNVFLDPIGDIQVDSINAQGGTSGKGGTVDITTNQFFRVMGSFSGQNGINASISTIGGSSGGDISIRHGGNGVTPFIVGNASTNGTAGAITTGNFTIAPVQSFPYTYSLGNIQIISVDPPTSGQTTPLRDTSQSLSISPGIVSDFVQLPAQPATPLALGELPDVTVDPIVAQLEQTFTSTYQNYLGQSNTSNSTSQTVSLPEAQFQLQQVEKATSIKPALIYAFFVPTSLPSQTAAARTSCHPNPVGASCPTPPQHGNLRESAFLAANLKSQPEKSHKPLQITGQFNSPGLTTSTEPTSPQPNPPQDNDQLELVLVTSTGKPIQRRVTGATRKNVLEMADKLRAEITNPIKQRTTSYLPSAQQLYQWLVTPLEKDLQAQQINNLVFIMDAGLRSVPLAALHNGSGFIVERYSVGLMPSVSLTDTRYVNVKNTQVLAMGASTFTQQKPLPATSTELSVIAEQLWSGKTFFNDAFTLDNLKGARAAQPFGIIHLATHANFQPGQPSNSYIQLWGDDKLRLDQLSQLGWNNPPVELLVLSACRTAMGDEQAELGFTGLATLSGVKTALGSLWYVSDEGTLGLMSEFYEQLKEAPIKAEALRQAQLAMIQGNVRLEGGKLITSGGSFPLPPELAKQGDTKLSHPYFWSGFSMVGNPW